MEPTYSREDLESLKGKNHKFTFEGKEYDGYSSTQMQRRVEREIRKQKRLKTAYEAAGLTDEATAANIRLRRLNEKYREFSKEAGLPEQRERIKVSYVDDASTRKAAELLEKQAESGILNDTNYRGIPVTEEAIQRVPQIQPDGWSVEQAEHLQEAHRELLRSVMDKPVGTEAGAIYSPDMKLIERRVGTEASHQITLPHYTEPHTLIHSHPSGLTFSEDDIKHFIKNFDMSAFTAVGNNGAVYTIQKTDQYNAAGFVKSFGAALQNLKNAQTPQEYANIMNRFLEEAEQYGIKFVKGR